MGDWTYRFVIDVWAERRASPELPAVVRVRVWEVEAGVERREKDRYVGSFEEIAAIVEARLDADRIRPRRWERS